MIGGLRCVSQIVSYEVSISFCFLVLFSYYYKININNFFEYRNFTLFTLSLLIIFFPNILSEMHRTPFDFSERESELVSGFNTELGGSPFSLIFIREYLNIIIIRLLLFFFFFIYVKFFSI